MSTSCFVNFLLLTKKNPMEKSLLSLSVQNCLHCIAVPKTSIDNVNESNVTEHVKTCKWQMKFLVMSFYVKSVCSFTIQFMYILYIMLPILLYKRHFAGVVVVPMVCHFSVYDMNLVWMLLIICVHSTYGMHDTMHIHLC